MPKRTHHEVKFSKEEMDYDIPEHVDFSKMRFVGRGKAGIEMARRISRAKGEEKRKLLASLPFGETEPTSGTSVKLAPDVAKVFKDSQSVNEVLRAFIGIMPKLESKKQRKTA